jgi:hypothetical protein
VFEVDRRVRDNTAEVYEEKCGEREERKTPSAKASSR